MKHVKVLTLLPWLWGRSLGFLPSVLVPTNTQLTSILSPDKHLSRQFAAQSSNQNRRRKSSPNWRNQESDFLRPSQNSRWRGHKPARRVLTSRREESFKAVLKNLHTPTAIDGWMESIVEEQSKSGYPAENPIDASWTSRDETDFIRYLRDRQAFKALEIYACCIAKQNVFVYTAAISALANSRSRHTRKRALTLLDRMDDVRVLPSSFTMAALFQSVDGPEEASNLMTRLQKYNGKTTWYVEAYNQAIIACGRRDPRQPHPTNKGWQIALEFLHRLRAGGLSPDWKTYSSLLNVCAQTGQLKIALSLAREIESMHITKQPRILGALLTVCGQAGDYKEANQVLTKMQSLGHRINLADCSAFLKALSRHGLVKSSFQVLDMMTLSNRTSALSCSGNKREKVLQVVNLPPIPPDLVALNTILACCAKAEDFHSARLLLDCMKNGEFLQAKTSLPIYPDEISYSLLLSSCSDPIAAKGIVKEMQLSRRYRVGVVRPSNITYARAIAVCRKAEVPDVETARFFLSSAQKDGIKPTLYMYTAAIWTAERSANFTFAKEILEEMKANGVKPNSISYTGTISAAGRCGLVDEAVALYKEFKEDGKPSAAMYNALAMAVKYSQAPNNLEILEDLFDGMDASGRFVTVGGPVIEALINEYGTRGQYENATKVFRGIRGPCNEACLRSILRACATADPEPKWAEAVSILHSSDITRSSAGCGQIDQGGLSYAMIACAKADRWEEGLNILLLYGVKSKRSQSVSTVAMNAVMAACGRNGRPDVAVSLLNEMEGKYGVIPDERSYRSAIIACNQAEHNKRRHKELSRPSFDTSNQQWDPEFQWWECALALLRRMKESGLKPDIQTLSSCISACEAAGQWQRALGVLQSMINENSGDENILNLFCFNAAISSCEKGGAWIEALEIYERMISYGDLLMPNFVTLSSLVLALTNAGQKELAESKYKEGVKMKIVNPWRFTKDAHGQRIKAMDLHKFNSAMACTAVRSHIDSILDRGGAAVIDGDLVIIVGKGLRSWEGAKLLPAIKQLLLADYGLAVEVDSENSGRIIVDASSLRDLVTNRSWR